MGTETETLRRVMTGPLPLVDWRHPGRMFRLWSRSIRLAHHAAALHGGHRRPMIARARRLLGRELFHKQEIRQLGLLNPGLTDEECRNFLSREATTRLELFLNPEPARRGVEDKGRFYQRCCELDLPMPPLWGIYSPGGNGRSADGRALTGHQAWLGHLAQSGCGDLVVKPAICGYGHGVNVLHRKDDGQFVDPAGNRFTPRQLFEQLDQATISGDWILQERITNHTDLVELSRSRYLQTVRTITMTDAQERVHVIHAHCKLIVGNNHIDNFHYGATGNLIAGVERETGTLREAWTMRRPEGGFAPVSRHPVSGREIAGFQLPDWQAALDLAKAAADAFRPLRLIGWDVALTPAGPVLVEGNWNSDPPNTTASSGRWLARIEALL